MSVVILGGKGMLGGQLMKLLPSAVTFDKEDLDVTDVAALRQKLAELKPDTIINCVAYNDVDGAETHRELALRLNAELVKNLVSIANELDATLVHFSTGYVFNGSKAEYQENDPTHPLSTYGQSKAQGEQELLSAKKYYLIRTNVLFGPTGQSPLSKQSFVDKMLELAQKQSVVKAVTDETNSITYAPDLASSVVSLLNSKPAYGIYHIVNQGSASWYELAQEIFRVKGLPVEVLPVSGAEFPRPARRARHLSLANTKLPALRPWQEALQEYLSPNNN